MVPDTFICPQSRTRQVDRCATSGHANRDGFSCIRPHHHGIVKRPLRWPCAGHKDEGRPSGASLSNIEDTDV